MTKKYTPQDILLTQMEENEFKAETIGQFLACLTRGIFSRTGLYSDKQPFAQNRWEENLAYALVLHGHIDGTISVDSELEFDTIQFSNALDAAMTLLHDADYSTLSLPPEPKEYYLLKFDSYGDLVDTESVPYTQGEAIDMLDYYSSKATNYRWKAIQIRL